MSGSGIQFTVACFLQSVEASAEQWLWTLPEALACTFVGLLMQIQQKKSGYIPLNKSKSAQGI